MGIQFLVRAAVRWSRRLKLAPWLASLTLLPVMIPPASALLLGNTVQADYLFPTQTSVFQILGTATVNPTALFNSFGQTNYLVTDDTLQITNVFRSDVTFLSAAFNGVEISDLTNAPITAVTVDSATNLAGFSAADVSFDASHIFVNLQSLVTTPTTLVQLDITGTAPAIPEPDSLALLAIGIFSLFLLRRRYTAQ
jgi:hypothetical protein